MSFVLRRSVVHIAIALLGFGAASACADSSGGGGGGASTASSALTKPDKAALSTPAPDSFRVAVETSKGNFTILVHRDWAPKGADRFYHLVQLGFFDDARFFRVLKGFMAQFGVNGDPKVSAAWEDMNIEDDPVKQSNKRGMVTFAQSSQPNTRSTQLFINYADNANLDGMGFAPIGEVVEGMAVVDSLYGDYGEGAPDGGGPDQGRIMAEGNKYLETGFPKLDFIRKARIVTP
jgi:peptidyl-prolyl cis-trans isomerase A (cyclophilin A)